MALTGPVDRMTSAIFEPNSRATVGPEAGVGPRTLLVVLGSVGQPYGGSETRARLTAEVLTSLGITTHVVSHL